MTDPSHAEILAEVKALRGDVQPLVEIASEIEELVEFKRAVELGGKSIRWLGAVAAALAAIGALVMGVAAAFSWVRGG